MKNKWKEIILVICVSYTVISVCAVIVNTIAGTQNNNFNTIMMLVLTAISVCVLYLYKLFDRFSPLLTITLQYLIALALATAVLLICGLFDEISENGCRDFFVSFTVFYAIGAVVFYMFGIISYKASTELHFFYNQPILTVSGLKICLMVGGFISLKQISRRQPRNKGHSKQAIFRWFKN